MSHEFASEVVNALTPRKGFSPLLGATLGEHSPQPSDDFSASSLDCPSRATRSVLSQRRIFPPCICGIKHENRAEVLTPCIWQIM